ncbi:hypothetical protein [Streptomyces sp. NPDC089799]|uniref:hypothetical protein n=1 Tax=Streptomyces sp. NPDC089799 TaxID=3155066 RepID=UPI00342C9B07
MSVRQTVKVSGAAMAAVLALTLAGCGMGDDEKPKGEQPKQTAASQTAPPQGSATGPAPSAQTPLETLGTSNGPANTVLVINSVVRDSGGFVTVSGQIKNNGSGVFGGVAVLRGTEKNASPGSVAGATLVDRAGKKRYYVLRDTEGRCLCTTDLPPIGVGKTVSIMAQFPSPPATTTEVDFGLPTFASVNVKISG